MPGIIFAELMKDVIEKNISFRFTALGFSMLPFIHDGDVITVAPVFHTNLRIGDVVAFINPICNQLAVHRILLISQSGYLIKGDNTNQPDGQVLASNIIGRVIQVEHCGKNVGIGIGVERIAIAWLSFHGLLKPNIWKVWRFIRPIVKLLDYKKK